MPAACMMATRCQRSERGVRESGSRSLLGGSVVQKERDVLLTEREINRGQRVKGRQFAWVDLNQANMRHRPRDRIGLSRSGALLFLALLALLVHQ